MKIKTGLMTAILVIIVANNTSSADTSQDAVLGASFAKCTAIVTMFRKIMPNLELPAPNKEQEERLNTITGMYALATFALVGKEKAQELLNKQITSQAQVAEATINIGDAKTYASYAGLEIQQCMNLFESNSTMLKPKIEAIAEAYQKKDK